MLSRLLSSFNAEPSGYNLIPTNSNGAESATSSAATSPRNRPPLPWLTGRSWKRIILRTAATILGFIFLLALYWKYIDVYHGLPSYDDIREMERRLPQHALSLPWPEGKNGRFVKFADTWQGVGFNNVLQDILVVAHIAHIANRAYVFQPYLFTEPSWMGPVIWHKGHWRSASIPLNTFISGPAAGGPFVPETSQTPNGQPATSSSPRAVSYDFFDEVCPPWRRSNISVQATRAKYNIQERENDFPETKDIIAAFGKELLESNETCIVVQDDHVITLEALGRRVFSAVDILRDSPIIQLFNWSTLVRDIVSRNLPLITGASSSASVNWDPLPSPGSAFPGVVACHIRRGDYKSHCPRLSSWKAVYYGLNALPAYRDHLGNPAEMGTDAERLQTYMPHCLPTVNDVVTKLRAVKKDWETASGAPRTPLKRIFILTNGERSYRKELQRRLYGDGWEHVVTSNDLVTRREESEYLFAADMMVAEHADVFVGNGFSSVTSNVNLLRLSHGAHTDSIRFW